MRFAIPVIRLRIKEVGVLLTNDNGLGGRGCCLRTSRRPLFGGPLTVLDDAIAKTGSRWRGARKYDWVYAAFFFGKASGLKDGRLLAVFSLTPTGVIRPFALGAWALSRMHSLRACQPPLRRRHSMSSRCCGRESPHRIPGPSKRIATT